MSAPHLPPEQAPRVPHLTPDAPDLQFLLQAVNRAREEQQVQRGPGAAPDQVLAARWATMEALENYAAALAVRCWPVPRDMQRDLRLLRALCGVRPGRPGSRS